MPNRSDTATSRILMVQVGVLRRFDPARDSFDDLTAMLSAPFARRDAFAGSRIH